MILYREHPKDVTKKLHINELSKAADTKLIYRNLLHFYGLITLSEKLREEPHLQLSQKE